MHHLIWKLIIHVIFAYLHIILCFNKVNFVRLGRNFDLWNQLKFMTWEIRQRWEMNTGRTIPTGENVSIWIKICPSAMLSTKNVTWTGLGLNTALCIKRLATNHLSHGTALKIKMDLLFIYIYIYLVYTLWSKWCVSKVNTNLWRRLYSERITVCSENHMKHIGTLCKYHAEFLALNLAVQTLTSRHWGGWGKNRDRVHYRKGCWKEYLDITGELTGG